MISIAMSHQALEVLCVDRGMPVEPLFQTTFVYLFLAALVIISLLLFRYLLTALKSKGLLTNRLQQWKAPSLAAKRSRGKGLGWLTSYQ